MNAPKVTVLMAVYNAENYLRQAIESILSQSFEEFELLIHDDGSTDHSAMIIQSYRDSRIRAVLSPINQGEARVRNQCLQIARGEYIAVLDADDVAHRNRLQIQTDFLDRDRGISLVGSPYEIIDESGRVAGTQRVYSDELTIKWGLLFGNQFGHSTVMCRRKDVLAVGGYDEALSYGMDFDLWVRLTTRGRLTNLLDPLAQYRVHSQNTTHTLRSSAKENGIFEAVAKSIQLLTGQAIDLEVAQVLTRDFYKPASSNSALELTFDTICRCLGRFITSGAPNHRERQTIVNLAVQDLFRIAHRNPGSLGLAQMKALRLVARYDPCSLVKRRYVGILAEQILPSSVVGGVKRVLRTGPRARDIPIRS
jgi:glycosyltransferase involved in cell wall biosynthesis